MKYQHERKESSGCRNETRPSINTEAPPAPLREQWALDMMKEYLEGRGLSYERALSNGCYPVERRGYRLYVPARTRLQGHMYWQARSMDGSQLRWDSPYTPRRDALTIMYGRFKDRTPVEAIVIVEGPMDALAVASLDLHIGIALMGINPTGEALEHLVNKIQMFTPKHIYCVADSDQIAGMCKVQSYMAMRGFVSKLIIPLAHKDIACYSVEERRELLRG